MKSVNAKMKRYGAASEKNVRKELHRLFKNCPIPEDELLMNVGLFLTPQTLSRILFMDFLYRQVLEVQGVVIEFGSRWGQNLALFMALRGIYEPFNRLRKIVGFDTFEGFLDPSEKDGKEPSVTKNAYSVTKGYEKYLSELLQLQEQESPLSHLKKKHEIVKGDASKEIEHYFKRQPETIVALAYFDMDLYEPTAKCLSSIRERLTRGSVIGFDELNEASFPGETMALKEVLGLGRYSIRRFPHNTRSSYIVIDD
jgi:hypothetical protein